MHERGGDQRGTSTLSICKLYPIWKLPETDVAHLFTKRHSAQLALATTTACFFICKNSACLNTNALALNPIPRGMNSSSQAGLAAMDRVYECFHLPPNTTLTRNVQTGPSQRIFERNPLTNLAKAIWRDGHFILPPQQAN